MRSEIRKDYIQDKYVIIAPRRAKRHLRASPLPRASTKSTCFFCPENIKKDEVISLISPHGSPSTSSGTKVWKFAVLENKFAAVSTDNPRAYGRQEIIVETPDPVKQLEDLPAPHIAELLKLYSDRIKAIARDKKIKYSIIFKNMGGSAGATIVHSHSQIFATDFIPPHLADKSEKVLEYRLKHDACVYCDVIKKERHGPRFVAQDGKVIAFAPYASMYNYELWILPTRHIHNITDLTARERASWARILKKALGAVSRLGLPYNYYFHENLFDPNLHLYMKITPRGSVWAGVEIGSGLVINAVPPEEAARYYRTTFR